MLVIKKKLNYKNEFAAYEVFTNHVVFHFTKHSIERVHQRCWNIKTEDDDKKFMMRVVKVFYNRSVYKWICNNVPDKRAFRIHDVHTHVVYEARRTGYGYSIITVFNEYEEEFRNEMNEPELYINIERMEYVYGKTIYHQRNDKDTGDKRI